MAPHILDLGTKC